MDFTPSKYQQAIFDWVQNGRGDAVVEAVAGSGKTKTLVECSKLLKTDKAVFLAFNKHIANELQAQLGKSMTAKTIHSVGLGAIRAHLGKTIVDDYKYKDIAKKYADDIYKDVWSDYLVKLNQWRRSRDDEDEPEEPPTASAIANQLRSLSQLSRLTLTQAHNYSALEEMIHHFGCLDESLDLRRLHIPLTDLLREGEILAESKGIVDYADMLWLPWRWQLEPYKQEWIFVDEAQDLSPAQMHLVLSLRGRGGRILFVGDKNQAIMGFAGALSDSIDRITKATKAVKLPLSICYRCPRLHIELAKRIVKQIEPAPGAVEGIVEHIKRGDAFKVCREGDLIISRRTAPAVKMCIELIARRVPARVRGRDIGKSLTTIVRTIATHPEFDFEQFGKFLQDYWEMKREKLQQRKHSETQIESLSDRIDGIHVCYESFHSLDIDGFCDEIEQLFSDHRSSVTLSTVHRAKGLEESRVFILEPRHLPFRWQGQQEWERQQELNLKYVALTRAKSELYFIDDEDDSSPKVKEG